MASSINGTSTGSGGLISTGDDSGILNIQTNETTAITVDASQRAAFVAGTAALPAITTTGDTNTGIFFPAADTTAFTEGGVEAMRIDSSGNVGIGTTSPAAKFQTNSTDGTIAIFRTTSGANNGRLTVDVSDSAATAGFAIGGNSSFPAMTFANGGSERMRIDSSGNLLVGTTSAGGSRMVVNGATGGTAVLAAVNSTGSGNQFGISSSLGSTANNTSSAHFQGGTASAGNWYLLGNGTTTYTSDQRLKKNIETTRDGYLADICRLRVVKYNWRNDAEGTDKELGLIAQEVEQVFPRLVQDDLNKISPDDETLYKTLKGSVIPYMLLKAIQELKAINDTQAETINALTARIVALESKA